MCSWRATRWKIATEVVPIDGCGLSFWLSAEAVVCCQEIWLLIVRCVVQQRARAREDTTLADKVNPAN